MLYRRPRDQAADAVRTWVAVSERCRGGAHESVVVNGVHNRNTCIGSGNEDRWRCLDKRVVDMNDIRAILADGRRHLGRGPSRPYRRRCEPSIASERSPLSDLGVVEEELLYADTRLFKQSTLRFNDRVLAAALAVPGVDLKHAVNEGM
jgi:hypothetical protein